MKKYSWVVQTPQQAKRPEKENTMPPSGFSQKAVEGALVFVQSCYEDLLEEVRSGKHASYEEGIKFEIAQIKKALTKLHIDAEGTLVER